MKPRVCPVCQGSGRARSCHPCAGSGVVWEPEPIRFIPSCTIVPDQGNGDDLRFSTTTLFSTRCPPEENMLLTEEVKGIDECRAWVSP